MQEVVKKEILKLLDTGIIYPIADSPWVSPIHCVSKKGGITVVANKKDELVPTRTVTVAIRNHDSFDVDNPFDSIFVGMNLLVLLWNMLLDSLLYLEYLKLDHCYLLPISLPELFVSSHGGTMTMSLMHQWHDTICGGVISPRRSLLERMDAS
ncbi:hypothetical protein Tco_0811384 [Tanacetum coccineum]